MKKHLILAAGAFLASTFLVACGDDDDDDAGGTSTPRTTPTSAETPTPGETTTPGATETGSPTGVSIEVVLDEVDGSGITGEAVVSEATAGGAEVVITMDDNTFTGAANVHTGTCDDFDETPESMLGNVASGTLQAELDATMDELEEEDHVIVVVDEAAGDPVACGLIES